MADDMIHLGHGSQHLKLDLAGRQKGWGRWCHWSEHAYSGGLACGSSVRTRFGNTEWAWGRGGHMVDSSDWRFRRPLFPSGIGRDRAEEFRLLGLVRTGDAHQWG